MISPTIAIIGSGAVGGYYGARLARHGHSVHFLLRSDFETVRKNGWNIQSCGGDFTLPPDQVHSYRLPGEMPRADLIIVTLKTTANVHFESLISPLLKEDSAILTLQNGLGNEDSLAQLFGARRVLGGLAFTCINRIGPGAIRHLDHGLIRLGEFGGGPSTRASTIAQLFNESGVECQVLDDLRLGRWEKLVWNVPFNGLGAALDLTTDRLLACHEGRSLVRQCMTEVIAIASALGIQLPANIIQEKIEQTRSMGAYHTSMHLDRKNGRPMETQSILSLPLKIAKQLGVDAPFLHWLHDALKCVESTT